MDYTKRIVKVKRKKPSFEKKEESVRSINHSNQQEKETSNHKNNTDSFVGKYLLVINLQEKDYFVCQKTQSKPYDWSVNDFSNPLTYDKIEYARAEKRRLRDKEVEIAILAPDYQLYIVG